QRSRSFCWYSVIKSSPRCDPRRGSLAQRPTSTRVPGGIDHPRGAGPNRRSPRSCGSQSYPPSPGAPSLPWSLDHDVEQRGNEMRIAVTGAAGGLGGRVVGLLAERGDVDVVAMTRRSLPVGAFPARVSVAVADYADPPALRAALKGVDT